MSNLRQIGEAARLYALDYDGVPPKKSTHAGTPWSSEAQEVIASLRPYGAAPDVWFCPSDPDRGRNVVKDDVQHWLTSYALYGWTDYLGQEGGPDGRVEPPDIIGLNTTACRFFYVIAGDARANIGPNWWRPHEGMGPASWHSGGFNVVYIDAHAKWLPMRRGHDPIPNPFVSQ